MKITLTHARGLAVSGLTAALVAASLALGGSAVYAATEYEKLIPNDGRDLGELIITLKPGATVNDPYPIQSVTTAPGALPVPSANRAQGAEILQWDNNVDLWGPFYMPADAIAAGRGLDGGKISYSDSASAHIGGYISISDRVDWTADGNFKYVLAFSSNLQNIRPHQEGVVFYSATLHADENGLLSIVGGDEEAAVTTTSIAISGITATAATLTAAVTPAAASGEIVFKHGETELGRETVSGGVASITATLPAATSFAAGDITAEFTPADPDAFVASTGQAPAFSTAAASGTIGIGGSVPAASDPGVPSGLKLQIASGDVKLQNTQARVSGQSWTASGDTPNITVLDDRRNASAQAWTLNGRSSKFSDGAKEIAAAQLGWTPALVSAAETANLAAAVTGGVEGGLSTDKALATGPTPTTGVDVSAAVKANLALVVPSTAEAGQNYTATLTLTLI